MGFLDDTCNTILALDKSIRFVSIFGIDGEIIAAKYRAGLKPLLSKEETLLSINEYLRKMKSDREEFELKLGRNLLRMAFYEHVKYAALPIGKGGENVLIISFDIDANHSLIIRDNVMPLIEPYAQIREDYRL